MTGERGEEERRVIEILARWPYSFVQVLYHCDTDCEWFLSTCQREWSSRPFCVSEFQTKTTERVLWVRTL
jgi:hypothetical protein